MNCHRRFVLQEMFILKRQMYRKSLFVQIGQTAATQAQKVMIKNVQMEKCIHVTQDSGRVSLVQCKHHSEQQQWIWDHNRGALMDMKSNRCLTVHSVEEFSTVKIEPCETNKNQAWTCDKRGHLTLQNHDLHLTAKLGTKKVFVSKGRDKFSKWKTTLDESVCKGVEPTQRMQHKDDHVVEQVSEVIHESKLTSTTERVEKVSSDPTQLSEVSITSGVTDSMQLSEADKDEADVSAVKTIIEKKYVPGKDRMGWKMAMLILSPFAFMLGGIILVLNIQQNKKRKLSALPSYPKSIHKFSTSYEQAPLTGRGEGAETIDQPPQSPTLRHGEILIEWKDGTVTPLYDHQQT
ncbi:uncharacterized protein LOC128648398 isoform X2 [Bombina bombina]|uniref:uncharacterized protein LOC128648398 isoform X2 n=1 Tax=Bombina bombina TaxID=8345 RepID=UPI00235B10B5|nr:uncharacterized protein LOC128648398 isoform X2 [Bombina bombina]